jgi:hypothetical protein
MARDFQTGPAPGKGWVGNAWRELLRGGPPPDPFPPEREQKRDPITAPSCGRDAHEWQCSVDLEQIPDRFHRQVCVGVPVAGVRWVCSKCGERVDRLRPEDRPRPRGGK